MIKRNIAFSQQEIKEQKVETVFHRQHQNKKIFGLLDTSQNSLLTTCFQCTMGPCFIHHQNLPFPLKLISRKKLKGICGDRQSIIMARNLLSSVIKGSISTSIQAKFLASFLLETSSKIKNERKLQEISQRFEIAVDKKEVALKALNDIENSASSPMSFISKFLPSKIMEDLLKINIVPNSASSEFLWANHLCTMGGISNPEDFLIQSFRMGLVNLGTMMITSELQDTLLVPSRIGISKAGLEVLEEIFINIVLVGHSPLIGAKIIELATSDEMINKAKNQGARGINVLGLGCVGNEVSGRYHTPWLGSAYQQEFALNTGLVEIVVADAGCVYPNLQEIANSFHTQFIRTQEIKHDKDALEVIERAIKNFTNRKKTMTLDSSQKAISFSAGFSFDELIDILSKIEANDPLKPLLNWLVSGEIHGLALLIGCTKLEDGYLQIIKELLKKNILILGVGCSIYSCIEAGFLSDQATVEYTGRELGNVLCSLAKITNLEKALPPIWHFGSLINFSHILKFICAISTRLEIKLKDIPIVALVNELGIEKPTAIGFGILTLGIPVHFGLNQSLMKSNLIDQVLTKKISELFEGSIILETDPLQAAKLLLGSIDEKRIGLNI